MERFLIRVAILEPILEPILFQPRSEDNQTTVIAVRGTLDCLDVLQDVSLWIVPVLLQFFGLVGLDTAYGAWGMATAELSQMLPMAYIDRKKTVESVLSAAELMINQHPEREYYITGHSLGGGVAKLVKLAIKIPQRARQEVGNTFLLTSLSYIFGGRTLIAPLKGEKHWHGSPLWISAYFSRLQVVTFAAPGVHHAAHVLMHQMDSEKIRDLHAKMTDESVSLVAVRPSNDIISLIDQSRGQTWAVSCSGTFYECHSIYRTLWDIFSVCGSMRGSVLRVPCGWSPKAPCWNSQILILDSKEPDFMGGSTVTRFVTIGYKILSEPQWSSDWTSFLGRKRTSFLLLSEERKLHTDREREASPSLWPRTHLQATRCILWHRILLLHSWMLRANYALTWTRKKPGKKLRVSSS